MKWNKNICFAKMLCYWFCYLPGYGFTRQCDIPQNACKQKFLQHDGHGANSSAFGKGSNSCTSKIECFD